MPLFQIINVNVGGILSVTKAFLPFLKKTNTSSKGANVINISSLLGSIAENNAERSTSYRISKAAVNMATKCFANENPDLNFISMHPGWVQTDMGSSKNRKPPVPVPEAARGIIATAENLDQSDSGSFWSFQGEKLPY